MEDLRHLFRDVQLRSRVSLCVSWLSHFCGLHGIDRLAHLAPMIGTVLGVKSAGIQYEVQGKRRSLRIEHIASAEIEAVAGADGGETAIHNHPLCVSPGFPAVVARSKLASFHDFGLNLEVSEKNGFYSPFSYQSA